MRHVVFWVLIFHLKVTAKFGFYATTTAAALVDIVLYVIASIFAPSCLLIFLLKFRGTLIRGRKYSACWFLKTRARCCAVGFTTLICQSKQINLTVIKPQISYYICRFTSNRNLTKEFNCYESDNENQLGRRFILVLEVIKVHRTI